MFWCVCCWHAVRFCVLIWFVGIDLGLLEVGFVIRFEYFDAVDFLWWLGQVWGGVAFFWLSV